MSSSQIPNSSNNNDASFTPSTLTDAVRLRTRVVREPEPSFSEMITQYISIYHNVRPAYQYTNRIGVLYNIYYVLYPSGMISRSGAILTRRFIPEFFFYPQTTIIRNIVMSGGMIELLYRNESGELRTLRNKEIPNTGEIFIRIPRLSISDYSTATADEKAPFHNSLLKLTIVSEENTSETEPNTTEYTDCGICYSKKTKQEMTKFQCSHFECKECIQTKMRLYKDSSKVIACSFCRLPTTHVYVNNETIKTELQEYIGKL